MDKKIGEVFEHNGVTLITIEDKNNDGCKGCYFFNSNICIVENDQHISCSALCRDDNKSVIFKKAEGMEPRTIKLTLEKAKEFYKKGGEFRDLALSAFTEEELTKVELPKTWEEFCSQFKIHGEYCINTDSSIKEENDDYRDPLYDRSVLPSKKAAEAHLALMQLHQLRDCYRQGWTPDWSDSNKDKYCIIYNGAYSGTNSYRIDIYIDVRTFLSFQSEEIAQLFLDNFRNLIKEAGDLI